MPRLRDWRFSRPVRPSENIPRWWPASRCALRFLHRRAGWRGGLADPEPGSAALPHVFSRGNVARGVNQAHECHGFAYRSFCAGTQTTGLMRLREKIGPSPPKRRDRLDPRMILSDFHRTTRGQPRRCAISRPKECRPGQRKRWSRAAGHPWNHRGPGVCASL